MKRVLALVALAACGSEPGAPEPIALFNGVDLTGWHADVPRADEEPDVAPSFIVRDGLLVSQGSPAGHLISDQAFRDYRLVVEYRWPGDPGDCGVLVHVSVPRWLYRMFPRSIECELQAGNAGDFWCIGEDISVRDPEERGETSRGNRGRNRSIPNLTDDSEKQPGEWNEMVVECRGSQIDVWVNGDHVNHGFDCTTDQGQIVIQARGAVCEFRRVELTPLTSTSVLDER